MTVQAIKTHLQSSPFKPVALITASGKTYPVPHPDFLTFSPSGRTCNVYAADGEFFSTLDVLTVTEIVPLKKSPLSKKKR